MYNDDIGKKLRKPNLGVLKHLEAAEKARDEKKKFDAALMAKIEKEL